MMGGRGLELEEPDVCLSPFSVEQTHTLRVVTLTGAGLSVVGCLFIIVSYALLLNVRTFPYKLVVMLSIANLGSSLAYYVGLASPPPEESDDFCNSSFGCLLAAGMTQFFDVASFFWIAVIAFNVYQVLVKNRGRAVEGHEGLYHLFAWGFSAALMGLVALGGAFGDAGIWCWIKVEHQGLRFVCYYLPLLTVFVATCTLYAMVGQSVSESTMRSTITTRLRLYVLVFVFVRLWSVIHRSQNYVSDSPSFVLALLHSLFSPLQGFANALVYGCNRQIAAQYRAFCRRPGAGSDLGDTSPREAEEDRGEPIEHGFSRFDTVEPSSSDNPPLTENELAPIAVS